MKADIRARDPGLQPERTALSWHRTAFSSLVLALVITRAGFSQGDIMLTVLGSLATLFSLFLVFISLRRQRVMRYDTGLTSRSAVVCKRLICLTLGLNALAITLHNVVNLF
ncbi:DUF202 domain-containing protein [Enterobacteriaceae bacterium H11S18]|uniref:DUF202 domain-containing protein n=1 Tax=Dryocola clanedunensis TaxID=2925396 RepID=UPI0022F09DC3|nr:DUF202 domain-containing protein [Dryocola clanedunensis]MCT4708770.1 DUF202 domain-containing protein [Dryocola clanedunensis]